jgi:hypothetical protein
MISISKLLGLVKLHSSPGIDVQSRANGSTRGPRAETEGGAAYLYDTQHRGVQHPRGAFSFSHIAAVSL